jgi:hypothetical protein
MGLLADGRLIIDFYDGAPGSSSATYPTNPDDGTTIYVKQ